VHEFGHGDIGAVAKLKRPARGMAGRREEADRDAAPEVPAGRSWRFAIEPKSRGDERRSVASLRRLQQEDPTIDLIGPADGRADSAECLRQSKVIVDRYAIGLAGKGSTLQPPRVPYQGDPGLGQAHGKDTEPSGGRGGVANATSRSSRCRSEEFRVRRQAQGRRDSPLVHSGGGEGRCARRAGRRCRGLPGSRACACGCSDGSHHAVDSTRSPSSGGLHAMRQALEQADPGLARSRIMLVSCRFPRRHVGE